MAHADFAHLHVHTQYSLLDGACTLSRLIDAAARERLPALAITDHGNMFGAIEFYMEAKAKGVMPIIGCELYIAPGSRFDKSTQGIHDASFHLLLLARDEAGYQNLMKLVTIANLEGFYYRPRIDREVLAANAGGLLGLSACLHGEIPHMVLAGQTEKAVETAGVYQEIFGKGNFYLELMNNNLPEQAKVNTALLDISRRLSIPVVATNDVHYLEKKDAYAHDILLCIQTQTTLDDPNRLRFQTEEFYFKSPEEMKELFKEVPQAFAETIKIVEKCSLELSSDKPHLPHFKPPEGKAREPFLKELCEEGLKKRFGQETAQIRERLEYELSVISKAGYTSYFLIAWDAIRHAREKGIPVGPGRGSAAGSLVAYLLGITGIDPLRYGLLFERLLNPERVSPPDIDIDFSDERRGEVIDYIAGKYGKNSVAQIITFGTMAAKGVIRDVGRVMGLPYSDVDRIAKLVPNELKITLEKALESEPELARIYNSDKQVARLIDASRALEGLSRHASTHAAGVVISERALTDYVPLFKTSDGQITTGYAMAALEKIGLLKMDFLGLRTLNVIDRTVKLVRETRGIELMIDDIPLEDIKTYALLEKAQTGGVFQLESSGMRDLLRKIKPRSIDDLMALIALFRPGPMHMLDDYVKRKHGQIQIKYDHPLLEPILKDTHGVMLYQEQVMKIANVLAGFSLSQADLLRRAMSKKTPEVMARQRENFVRGAQQQGVSKRIAEKVFDSIAYFAGYGFNKSHSAAYALVAYQTAYLKANFPIEFMAALLSTEKDNTDKIVSCIEDADRMGIHILPPDVNESFSDFTISQDKIRFGLAAVKNVGLGAVESIIKAREAHGRFKSLYDFCECIDSRTVNRKVLESLIKSGALDCLGKNRAEMLAGLDNAMDISASLQRDRASGQMSLFGTKIFKDAQREMPRVHDWHESQKLAFEKETLGFYISGHPLARYETLLKNYTTSSASELSEKENDETVSLGGIITKLRRTFTKKKNERMAILTMEDLGGMVDVLVYPEVYKKYERHLHEDALIFVKGRVKKEDIPKIVADEVIPLDDARQRYTKAVCIKLFSAGLEDDVLQSLRAVLTSHKGKVPVYIKLRLPEDKEVEILAGSHFTVRPTDNLALDVERLIGEGNIIFSRE